ncbi:Phage portal protein, SPP1 Gp6-like OS=Tsukamurella paurometabola (strain ATCC 8368 / DSM /CCUG 35730 / CIP 100753 / JCM 10117 / KCTC 9821 / NBRC 16120/ NCIMB 702349 / NCTC 13040) OX=521096 GN=Tpau_3894 PE=4 SV=1 [Tsukamurella paurometabola]|uniref:Phage portal protein, SPP1 Gp6-like n=1 Tax=Tsukamurella paurometabola (strain ATCC 8368 / DSM 20162 / CCUG 35730 / CIP 100753 / JCM 10117 / KCTC 9821 / NBRC 16120 / NCIMB 702349 / NCTC 13040) TaxID=521096 RepID=D5UMJ2_TSUPD|nr:phage portal protein [Tsukamurella paurometabola]ADG80466.1 protein of unknown function DUF1483 [Tsukamurella paurometabola DSM 20162]SUP39749.1 Phage portal protein, SPP1 Gp6-like [Tsukamurella paurometabola]
MDLTTELLQRIDANAGQHSRLDRYYEGMSPLAFLSPEAVKALGDRLRRVSVNVPRLLVDSMAERLRVTGIKGADVWDDWLRNDLDQVSHVAHREALILGSSFAIVWAGADRRPQVSIESARQMSMIVDPGSRRPIAAAKRWTTATTTEATIFEAEQITRLRANNTGATTTGFEVVEVLDNPLGVVPVVRFTNSARLLDECGRSEMADVLDLSDAVTKLTTDLLIASEFGARPRRWATGVELVEDDDGNVRNPFPEGDRMMISEAEGAKFGQLAGADLAGYENAIGVLMRQISAVSGLPEHQLGIGGDNPPSADSIRASEAALTARAEAKQAQFGRSWEQVARLIVGVRDGVDPLTVEPRIEWADAATRSEAQEADAVTKLYAAGLLPASYALKRLGYSDGEVDEIHAARARDAVANIDASAVLA